MKALGLEPRTYGLKVLRTPAESLGKSGVFTAVMPPMMPSNSKPGVDAELARVIATWPKLPRHLRAAVLALIQTVES